MFGDFVHRDRFKSCAPIFIVLFEAAKHQFILSHLFSSLSSLLVINDFELVGPCKLLHMFSNLGLRSTENMIPSIWVAVLVSQLTEYIGCGGTYSELNAKQELATQGIKIDIDGEISKITSCYTFKTVENILRI